MTARTRSDDRAITTALAILARRLRVGVDLSDPTDLHQWLSLNLGADERETVWAIAMDEDRHLLRAAKIFDGTLVNLFSSVERSGSVAN